MSDGPVLLAAVASAGLVLIDDTAHGRAPTLRPVLGALVAAVGLSLLAGPAPGLARSFAALLVVAALLRHPTALTAVSNLVNPRK